MPDNPEPISHRPYLSRFSQQELTVGQNGSDGQNQGDGQTKATGTGDAQTASAGQEKPKEKASLIEDFGRSLLHTVVQTPINALSQPIDRAFGTNILPNMQLIDAPQHAEFGTANYWAQQGGGAIGMLGTFWLAGKGVKAVTRAGQTEAMLANTLSRQSQIGLTLKEATATGFVHDFTFRPIEEGDKRNYLWARVSNGITGGATMLTLAGTGLGLKKLGTMAAVERSAAVPLGQSTFSKYLTSTTDTLRNQVVAKGLKNEMVGSVLAAAPAGLLSVNAHTFLKDRRLATAQENYESVVTMGVIGFGFGAHQHFKGRYESGRKNFEWTEKAPTENGQTTAEFKIVGGERALTEAIAKVQGGEGAMVKVREHLGAGGGWKRALRMQEYGPEKNLFIQHNDAAKGINYDAAKMADILAICQLDAALKGKSVVVGDNLALRAGKDRVRISSDPMEIKEGQNKPLPLGDRVQNLDNNMNNLNQRVNARGEEASVHEIVQRQLKETGLEGKGWKSQVTEQGSLMDMVGGDIILFNEKTGQMYMLDCTEQAKNPPAIRADGIIQIQKSWFRASGRGPEMPDYFPTEVGNMLLKLTSDSGGVKSSFNLRDVQLPSIKQTSDVNQLTEMRQFVHELERLSSDPQFRGNKKMVDEYASLMKETTLDHLEWAVHGTTNREVTRSAIDAAKDSIIDFFLSGKAPASQNLGDTKVFVKHNNVRPEANELRFRSERGDRIQIGTLESVFEAARKEMLPLSSTRAKQVETGIELARRDVKVREAVVESVMEKRQRATTFEELKSLDAELQLAKQDHLAAVEQLKKWTPENSIIQRIQKAGKTITQFEQFLMSEQGAIRNGGRIGLTDPKQPGILETLIKNKLTHKPEEFLFRNGGNGERPMKAFEEAGVSQQTAKELQSAFHNEWGILELKPVIDERVALSLSIFAETNPTAAKLVDGYEKGDPEAIRIVHRLLSER